MTLSLSEDSYQPELTHDEYAAKVITDAIRRGWEPQQEDPTYEDQKHGSVIAELVGRDTYERYWRNGEVFREEDNLHLWRAAAKAVKFTGTKPQQDTTTTTEEESADHDEDEVRS